LEVASVEEPDPEELPVLLFSGSLFRFEEDGWGVGVGDALREAGGEGGRVAGSGLVTGPSI